VLCVDGKSQIQALERKLRYTLPMQSSPTPTGTSTMSRLWQRSPH